MSDIVADLLSLAGSPEHLYAQPAAAEILALRERIAKILAESGEFSRPCRACGRPLTFVRTPAGNLAPYEKDGTNHFLTCPEAEKFRRRSAPSTGSLFS